jgi:uncharacterized damage-inducible protein DinB
MELRRLIDHSVWANLQWVDFVYSQDDVEPRPRELLAHVMVGERVWLDRIEGHPNTTTTFALLTRTELVQGFKQNSSTLLSLIDSRLEDVIHFRRASGEEYHARILDIIYHLLTHGYHHRGQIAAHYARAGAKYPNTDHINFLIVNKL